MDDSINICIYGPYFREIRDILRKYPLPHDGEAQMSVLRSLVSLFVRTRYTEYTIYICINNYIIQNCYELLHQNSRIKEILRERALENSRATRNFELKESCRRLIEFIDSIGDIFDTKEPDCF